MTDIRDQLIGTWSLIALRRFRDGTFHRFPMGEGATGRIIYAPSGYMSAFLMSRDWVAGTAKQEWSTFLAYSGRWLVEEATVRHHLDACSIAALIGQTLERTVEPLRDGTVMLRTRPHTTAEGAQSHDELVWARAI